MKILIVLTHPTQFEAPFFQFASKIEPAFIEVLYTDNQKLDKVFDSELNKSICWGIDLLSKYNFCVLPSKSWKKWLIRKFRSEKYDLVIVNGYYRKSLVFSAFLAKLFGSKVALRLDSVEFADGRTKKLFKRILFKPLCLFFNHFFVVGTLTKKYTHWLGVPYDKISVFSYVVNTEFFQSNANRVYKQTKHLKNLYGIDPKSKVVLAVSKFNKRETPWDLLNAAKELPENIHLLLVGNGEEMESLQRFAQENGQLKVSLAGYVPYHQLPGYYAIADLFVHAVTSEPWGVSVQEAMASGLPVITSSKVGASYDLISEGLNGFVYEAKDTRDLAGKIETILFNTPTQTVKETNRSILNKWNYQTSYNNIIKVALQEP